MKGLWETSEFPVAQNGRTEVGEGDVDAGEGEVAAVSEDHLHMTPMPMNTGETDVAAVTKQNITGVDRLFVATDSTEEEGDAGDADKTTITVTHDPLQIMALTHSPHHTPPTRHHLSL